MEYSHSKVFGIYAFLWRFLFMAMAYTPKDFVSNTGDENVYVALCIALCAHASCNVMKKIT